MRAAIENAFSKLKGVLRTGAERFIQGLWGRIGLGSTALQRANTPASKTLDTTQPDWKVLKTRLEVPNSNTPIYRGANRQQEQ
ncbi:hypothetical protein [Bradyrhizobium sp. CCBAU 53380]|uniref:hypothetical protein n=1 Tax=Bradyrhizobium sp. CCBAU 53380 TaxID=1325117 RepID=UPI002302B47F|nr:hypothetical protein [Bradyrhizobium sp. CCBAU 53380]